MQDAGNEIWDVRNGKSDVGNEDFECLHPIPHFLHGILIKNKLNWVPRNGKWDSNEDSHD